MSFLPKRSENPPFTKDYEFAAQDLLQLLVHYTDGIVPLNGEVREIRVHPAMTRKIGLLVRSDEWETDEPLFLGYDGKRTRSWSKGATDDSWIERNETPNRQ